MILPTTRLGSLDSIVLRFEFTVVSLAHHGFLNKSALPLLVRESATEVFCWAFNDCTDLRKLGNVAPAVVLLIVAVWIEDRPHFQKLEVTLELSSQLGSGEVVPLCTCVGFQGL